MPRRGRTSCRRLRSRIARQETGSLPWNAGKQKAARVAVVPLRAPASLDCIPRNYFAVPLRAELGRTFLRLEVDIVETESLAIAVGPFKVVHQAPEEVTLDRVPFRGRPMQMRQVIAQIHHAIGIFNASPCSDHIVSRAAVLGDVESPRFPDVADIANRPIDHFRPNEQPGRSHARIRSLALLNREAGPRRVRPNVLRCVYVEADEIERAADDFHVAGLDPGSVRRLALEIAVGVFAFHQRGEEGGVSLASRAPGGFDVFATFDNGHIDGGILGQTYLCSRL